MLAAAITRIKPAQTRQPRPPAGSANFLLLQLHRKAVHSGEEKGGRTAGWLGPNPCLICGLIKQRDKEQDKEGLSKSAAHNDGIRLNKSSCRGDGSVCRRQSRVWSKLAGTEEEAAVWNGMDRIRFQGFPEPPRGFIKTKGGGGGGDVLHHAAAACLVYSEQLKPAVRGLPDYPLLKSSMTTTDLHW